MIWTHIKMAFQSLGGNKLRSFLTMLGIIIGVFSVITLMSIGEGVRSEVSKQIEGFGTNLIIIIPGKIDTEGGINPGSFAGQSSLTVKDLDDIRNNIKEIKNIDGITLISGVAQVDGRQATGSFIIGSGVYVQELAQKEINTGRWINQDDLDNKSKVVYLDNAPKELLFPEIPNEEVIGQKITITKDEYEVIGIGVKKEISDTLVGGSTPFDNLIAIPITDTFEINNNQLLHRIMLEANNAEEIDSKIEEIKTLLINNHEGIEDFSVFTKDDLLQLFDDVLGIITSAIGGIAAISLIVGGIGIMNIMLVSVTERTKEIGIRKAVGASDGNILIQFLIESVILGLLGGFLGFVISNIVAIIIDQNFGIPTAITYDAIIIALGISIGVGIIFGIAPAIKASRKNPIEALRYE